MSREHHLVVPRTARYMSIGEATLETTDLWIVCHGYGQLASVFVQPFEKIAAPHRLIVAPEALSRFYLDPKRTAGEVNPSVGATWMTREDREAEIRDHVAYLDALVDHVRPPGASNRVRLRALGFSQGVATVMRWVMRGRVRVDELIVWAGSLPPEIDVAELRDRLAGARVVFVAGKRDQLASWAAADTQVERFNSAGIPATLMTFDGGHRLDDGTLAALSS